MDPIFSSDVFALESLTASINQASYRPRHISRMGLFEEQGIATTHAVIEREGRELALVPAKPRGAPGQVVGADKRDAVRFEAVHLPTVATVLADEVQNVRMFGSADSHQALDMVVKARLAKMAARLEATSEYHRVGAIRGKIFDADRSTVLVDLYAAFGIEQPTLSFALADGATDIRGKCLDVLEMIEDGLGETLFDGVAVICGSSFWRKLTAHQSVRETFLYQEGQKLRADGRDALYFGGITFERYRGGVGAAPFIPPTKAYAVPLGAPDMFITRFAPADYNEAVGTLGLPMYSSSEELPHGKGVTLEAQSNPIHLNTRPQAVIELSE